MTSPILEVNGITQRFGKFIALNNVSVAFPAGKLTAIIGPNGAGKSTFFNVISGAFAPTGGSIRFEGRDITGTPQHQFARMGIAKSFQITNIFRQLSAHENVRLAAQMRQSRFAFFRRRESLADVAQDAQRLLERVGLGAVGRSTAGDMSHGQQRALEIAMALASKPRLLLMDEPTAGMSPEETRVMMALIAGLNADCTVILVEHKMKLVMGLCERLIVLHHGELLAQGTPQEIRQNEEVKRVYLGRT